MGLGLVQAAVEAEQRGQPVGDHRAVDGAEHRVHRRGSVRDAEAELVVRVLQVAEAGVGKSRILRGFRDCLRSDPLNRILYYCSPYHRNSALYPVVDQLELGTAAAQRAQDSTCPTRLQVAPGHRPSE